MISYIQQGSRIYWKAIVALFLGSFVTFAILYCTQPIIPVFSKEFNVSPAIASLSISFATASLAAFMLIVSWLSDSKGRKLIMTTALLTSSVLAVVVAFSENFILILLIRAVQGALLGGFPAIAMAYINEEFNPQSTGLVMGIYVSGTSIGGMLGRVLIGALTDLFSWHIALAVIGIISLAVSIWFWFSLPNSRNFISQKRSMGEVTPILVRNIKQPLLLSLYTIGFLIMGSFVALFNYIGYTLMAPPYNLSQTVVGFIFVVYLTGTLSSTLMGKASDSIGNSKVLLFTIAIMLIGCLITLNINLFVKLMGIAIFTFGFFGSHSVASSWVSKSASLDKAQASALYLMFYYIGSSALGALGGKFLKWYGWSGVILLVSCTLVIGLLIGVVLFASKNARYKEKSKTALYTTQN
ncbi:MAG: major facilitator superfamily 1 [Firmicutes bacterium]|nr:major facilitator superfamily 1 [Bacillota bacterium]